MKECKNKPVETEYLADVVIDTLDSLPDNFLAERIVTDPVSGDTTHSLVRVPSGKLFPYSVNLDNVTALPANNDELEIPERQVRAGTVANLVSSTQVQYATADSNAIFLMLGRVADMVLIQNTGIVVIGTGHDYVIGATYYLGENGEPTTDSTSGIKLFVPISKTQLLVKL